MFDVYQSCPRVMENVNTFLNSLQFLVYRWHILWKLGPRESHRRCWKMGRIVWINCNWTGSTPRARTSPTTAVWRRPTEPTSSGWRSTDPSQSSPHWASVRGSYSGCLEPVSGAQSPGRQLSRAKCWQTPTLQQSTESTGPSPTSLSLPRTGTVLSALRWTQLRSALSGDFNLSSDFEKILLRSFVIL